MSSAPAAVAQSTSSEITIRPGVAEDYDAASTLFRQIIGGEFSLDRALWQTVCTTPERYRPLLAENVSGEPMGLAVVVISDRIRLAAGTRRNRFHVDDLIVSPNHRRKGVGRALLEQIKVLAQAQAPSYILINCDFMNVAARRTYESAGLTVTREGGDRFEIAFNG